MSDPDSYRSSHLGAHKAETYQAGYTDLHSAKGLDWSIERSRLGDILRRWPPPAGTTALDVACGTGRILAFLHSQGHRAFGIDISADMLAVARSRHPDLPLVRADTTQPPLPGRPRVGLVTAFRFFLNAEPELRAETLDAVHDLLVPGGVLVANFHLNPSSLRGTYLRLRGSGPGIHWMSIDDSTRLLADHGLVAREVHGYSYLPYRREGTSLAWPELRRRVETRLDGDRPWRRFASAFLIVATPTPRPCTKATQCRRVRTNLNCGKT